MKNKKGFTLIELLVVLTIIAIVTAITVPSIAGYSNSRRKKNCSNQMDMLVEEIDTVILSQRYSSRDYVDKAILRTILSHVEGTNIKNDSGEVISSADDIDKYRDSITGNVSLKVSNICTNGGMYDIAWCTTVENSGDDSIYTIVGKLDDSDTFVKCEKDGESRTLNRKTSGTGIKLAQETLNYLSDEVMIAYDTIQKYIVDNKVYIGNLTDFMTNVRGTLGTPSNSDYKKSTIQLESDNLENQDDSIVALTVNPTTGVLEYLAVKINYTAVDDTDVIAKGTTVPLYFSVSNEGSVNDDGTVKYCYFNHNLNGYYPYLCLSDVVYNESEVSVQGSRGSYTASDCWNETQKWYNVFANEEKESTTTTSGETSETETTDNTEMTGQITRIGNYPMGSTTFKWKYYHKNWYYEQQDWLANSDSISDNDYYIRDNDVKLKDNISDDYEGLTYQESITDATNYDSYHYLDEIKVTANYDVSDEAINKQVEINHNTYDMFKNSYTGAYNLNGYLYTDSQVATYNTFSNVDNYFDDEEDNLISNFNSAKLKEIYLTYNENTQTDQIKFKRDSDYKKIDLTFSENISKTTTDVIDGGVTQTYSRDDISLMGYYAANYNNIAGGTTTAYFKGSLDINDFISQLVVYVSDTHAFTSYATYTGEAAEKVLYKGGKYYKIQISPSSDLSKKLSESEITDIYYFAEHKVPDLYYTVNETSSTATIVSAKQVELAKGSTEEVEHENGTYVHYSGYQANIITIPSSVTGYWKAASYNEYSLASAKDQTLYRAFIVGGNKQYFKYIYDVDENDDYIGKIYNVTQVGKGDTSSTIESDNENSGIDGNATDAVNKRVYLPSNENLWTINISSAVTKIASSAFAEADNESYSEINYFTNNPDVTKGRYLKKVVFAENSKCDYIGSYAFFGCSNLQEVNIPSSVGNNLGRFAFAYDYNLKSIVLPKDITWIHSGTFLGCASLNEGEMWYSFLPEGVERIGKYAFKDCYKMTGKLELPDSLKTIGAYAFYNCHNINGIVIPSSVTSISSDKTFAYITTLSNADYSDLDSSSKKIEDIVGESEDNYIENDRGSYQNRYANERKIDTLEYNAGGGSNTNAQYEESMFICTNYEAIILPYNAPNNVFQNLKDCTVIVPNYGSAISLSGDLGTNSLVIENIGNDIMTFGNTSFQSDSASSRLFKADSMIIRGNLFVQNSSNLFGSSLFQTSSNLSSYANALTKFTTGKDYRGGEVKDITNADVKTDRQINTQFTNGNLLLQNISGLITTTNGGYSGSSIESSFDVELYETQAIRSYGFKSIWLDRVDFIDDYAFAGCLFADYAIIPDYNDDFVTRDANNKITSIGGLTSSSFAAKPTSVSGNRYGLIRGELAGYYDNVNTDTSSTEFDISKIDVNKSKEFELYLPNELYIYSKVNGKTWGADSIHPISTISDITKSEYYEIYKLEIDQCIMANGTSFFGDSSFEQDHLTEYSTIKTDKKTGLSTIEPFSINGYDYKLNIKLSKEK